MELSAAALRHSARASLATDRGARRASAGWLCLPVSHVAGLQVLVRSLVGGTEPVVAPAAAAPDALAASGCAHVSVVPTQLVRLLGEPGGAAALAGFSSCSSAARRPARRCSTGRGRPGSTRSPPTG